MTLWLRSWLTPKSMAGSSMVKPNSAAPARVRRTWAVSSSSLAGMQPRCRQVPPTFWFSIMATSRPAEAPYSAAA